MRGVFLHGCLFKTGDLFEDLLYILNYFIKEQPQQQQLAMVAAMAAGVIIVMKISSV